MKPGLRIHGPKVVRAGGDVPPLLASAAGVVGGSARTRAGAFKAITARDACLEQAEAAFRATLRDVQGDQHRYMSVIALNAGRH
jgi:hypothetical protein